MVNAVFVFKQNNSQIVGDLAHVPKFNLQILIYAICLVASFVCVVAIKPSGRYNLVETLVIAVVAGFLSPAISDLVAVINRWRKP